MNGTFFRADGSPFCATTLASTLPARMKGLLGRASLPPATGLWILPCSAIHTFAMRFAIAAVFLDDALTVTRVFRRLPPWRFWAGGGLRAASVIELPADDPTLAGLEPGERLSFTTMP